MLRLQRSDRDALSFLAGVGDMARLIRERDWSDHPLGRPDTWPEPLRLALSICLQSKFPTAIYWGPELRLLYNDAWAPIPGPRHPAALGAPAREVWSDIWQIIEPQFRHVIETGEGVFVQDYLLPMQRFGQLEETYWSYSFTAIRDDSGAIVGIFNSGYETTRNVLSQRQIQFLLALGDAMRGAPDSDSARKHALAMLGKHLGADRVGLREMASSHRDDFPVIEEWSGVDIAPLGGKAVLSDLGPDLGAQLASGRMLIVNDVAAELKSETAIRAFTAMGAKAAIAVPKLGDGELVAILFVHSHTPRSWTLFDINTAEQVLERIWSWIERERADERERLMIREIDHRAKNALAVVQAVIRLTLAEDISSFREKIEGRIAALMRTHDLLSAKRWGPIEFGLLVEREIEAYRAGDCGIELGGPQVMMRSEEAQTIALLLHELVTNAAKYGALSSPAGRLEVRWRVQGGNLHLDWLETLDGSAPSHMGVTHAGFGSKLITSVIEKQLGGSISRDFDHGLKCRIAIPMATLARTAEPVADESSGRGERSADAKRVLIVEDEALVALDLANMLRVLGYNSVETASNVAEALALLRKGAPPVLAIVDANLAGESSEPVVQALRARGAHIILASGYANVDRMSESFRGLACLPKPIILSDFTKAIQQATAGGL